MNTCRSITLFAGLLALVDSGSKAVAQVELTPGTIQGVARFSNTNPAILDLLNTPGDEGMSNLYIFALSSPPHTRTAASDLLIADSRTETSYQLTVDSDAIGIAYRVTPRISMLGENETYYFRSASSGPVIALLPGPTLDFEECLGVLTVRFVDSDGSPLPIDSGNLAASDLDGSSGSAYLSPIPGGATEQRIYLHGDTATQLIVTVDRGTSTYIDRIQFTAVTNVTVPCDEFATIDIIVPGAGALGEATGTVDMLGEFELTVDGYDAGNYADNTSVTARYGPFGNTRYGAVPGVNYTVPSSGAFTLLNLLPSTLDPASPGYVVSAEMYVRTHEALSYFRTPALGSGVNPPMVVTPGDIIDLGNLFVIDPGYLRGRVLLQGPSERLGRQSLLRGLAFASETDDDADGIPDALGIYGIHSSAVGATGLDQAAPGAAFTASYGYGYTGFKGSFNPVTSAYEGHYEMPLGGLNSEPSLWHRDSLSVIGYSGTVPERDYYYYAFSIADTADAAMEIAPGQTATSDAAYCLSEVSVIFRSAEPFYNPSIRFSSGGFTNTDFQGNPASYTVSVDPVSGVPVAQADAATNGRVVMYLPQGSYRLIPHVTPVNSVSALVSGDPIDITVGCGQRLSIEECLRVELDPPACAVTGPFAVGGSVRSCTNQVGLITYELNGAEPVAVCTNCGINPSFNLDLTLEPGANTLTIRATDEQGHDSFLQTLLIPDTIPPTLLCPSDLAVAASRPCGAVVDFAIHATDACDSAPTILCTPAPGSLFPPGNTIVTCQATDDAGNLGACSFTVSVGDGPEFPLPTLSGISPQLLGIAGGTQVTVTGTGFTADDEILLDGATLQYPVLISAEEIRGQAPSLPEGAHELQIQRCGEIVSQLSEACVSGTLPRILSSDPGQAFARGGNLVTLHGTNFLPTTQIRIAFPAPDGTANLLINTTVSADGTVIIGQMPPLPSTETLGSRDVIAEDARGADILPAGIRYLPNPAETDPQAISLRALQAASSIPLDLAWRNGFPGALLARVQVGGDSPEERARSFVRSFKDLLRVRNPDAELTLKRASREGLDDVRLVQNFHGVPVFGAEIVVTLQAGEVVALTGNLLPLQALGEGGFDLTPVLTPEEAIDLARLDENIQRPLAELNGITELMIYDECLFTDSPLDPHLVWRVKMTFATHEIMVDAHSGLIVARLPLARSHDFDLDIQTAEGEANAQDDDCFYLSDDVDVADEDDFNSDFDGNVDAVLANRFARDCWHYFHHHFDWGSYDNDGAQLEVFIHTTMDPTAVAQWVKGCDLMQFTHGAVDYEVLVHEFTHGIISTTSELEYRFQSGALDEHYADTMAVIADRERGEIDPEAPGQGQAINWVIGENLRMTQLKKDGTLLVPAPVRSFDNPAAAPYFHRAHMTNLWLMLPSDIANDFGGVHSNSGIPNKGAHLMIAGGSYGGFLVQGMGVEKVRLIKFAAMRYLAPNANFAAARVREIAAAEYFIREGQGGVTLADVCTVRNGWAAVGVGMGDSDCDGVQDASQDVDGDFVPNRIDNCPWVFNPGQQDPDGDGKGTGCDNCPNSFNPGQEDLDVDGQGDDCDDDLDGDGCKNTVDQDPNSNQHRIGSYLAPFCNQGSGPIYAFAGTDSLLDEDTLLDCEDMDDDGDGIPDFGFDGIPGNADDDPCPIGTLNYATLGDCTVLRSCPLAPKDWWTTCFGGGCVQYYAKFTQRINPDPTTTLIVDQIRIVNQTLYLQPNAGSVASLAQRITGVNQLAATAGSSNFALAAQAETTWRVELWARATDAQSARLVAVVGDYDAAAITPGQLQFGSLLALRFETSNAPPTLAATWHPGADPESALQDDDQDGLPDGWEIQYGLDPHLPSDALIDSDGDGDSNFAEFQAGTDPRDAASVMRILRINHQPEAVRVEFLATPGRSFQLEKTLDLDQPDWTAASPVVGGQGGVLTLSDSELGITARGFYRVRLVTP